MEVAGTRFMSIVGMLVTGRVATNTRSIFHEQICFSWLCARRNLMGYLLRMCEEKAPIRGATE
jgi:hypothetical protein